MQELNLIEMWNNMGVPAKTVAVILFLMSIYLVAVGIERFFFFMAKRKRSNTLVLAIREILTEKGASALPDLNDLALKNKDVPLASVVEAAADAFNKKPNNLDALDLVVGINRAVERTIERQTNRLKRGFGGLATIASTAPFVGLFGTVLGIINAFAAIQKSGGEAGMGSVAGGISEALITTAFGLLVAIPAVAVYNYFTNVVDKMVVDMDEVASEMVEAVVLQKSRS